MPSLATFDATPPLDLHLDCMMCVLFTGVQDTAQQKDPNYECYTIGTPASRLPNSCPDKPASQPRTDPVQNFMGSAHASSLNFHLCLVHLRFGCVKVSPLDAAPPTAHTLEHMACVTLKDSIAHMYAQLIALPPLRGVACTITDILQ